MLTLIMAKAQLIARLATEIAPPQLSSIVRRRRALPRRLDTIAEDDKEAAVEVELSSYALLHSRAPRRNTSYAREGGKSSAHGEKRAIAGNSSAHGEKRSVASKSSAHGKTPAILA